MADAKLPGKNYFPLRAVIDSCVFPGTREWLVEIVNDAREGYVLPLWAPSIIAELNRVLTWLWLKRSGGDFSKREWDLCSQSARRMFSHLTSVFRVLEDCPPYERAWTPELRDKWDLPIWTAAVRGQAQFVVTLNLEDGPPKGSDGVREHEGVCYVHPRVFLALIDRLAEEDGEVELPELPEDEPSSEAKSSPLPSLRELVTELQREFPSR